MRQHYDIKIPSSKTTRAENVLLAFFTPVFPVRVGLATPVVSETVAPGVVIVDAEIPVPGPLLPVVAGVLLGVNEVNVRLGF
jgi:hypothetical protein